jgi:hypothetical protein
MYQLLTDFCTCSLVSVAQTEDTFPKSYTAKYIFFFKTIRKSYAKDIKINGLERTTAITLSVFKVYNFYYYISFA